MWLLLRESLPLYFHYYVYNEQIQLLFVLSNEEILTKFTILIFTKDKYITYSVAMGIFWNTIIGEICLQKLM